MQIDRTTLVVGVSGVGKSRLVAEFCRTRGALHIRASSLLRDAESRRLGRPVGDEELRRGSLDDNQSALVEEFQMLRGSRVGHLVFDGHNVIDADDGLSEITLDVFAALQPSLLVVVVDDPARIAVRRTTDVARVRPDRSEEQLRTYQETVVRIAAEHAVALSIPMRQIESGDDHRFAALLTSYDDL